MQIYKPNAANKGSALSVNFAAKTDKMVDGKAEKGDKSFYFQLVSQTGWNPETKIGSFKDGKKLITKFAPHEISGMLAAIQRNISLAEAMNTKYVFHDGSDFGTLISFEPHFKSERKGAEYIKTDIQQGFSYRVTRTSKKDANIKDSIAIGFTWAELKLLEIILTDGLTHIANSWYAENINRLSENKTKKSVRTVKETPLEQVEDVDF